MDFTLTQNRAKALNWHRKVEYTFDVKDVKFSAQIVAFWMNCTLTQNQAKAHSLALNRVA